MGLSLCRPGVRFLKGLCGRSWILSYGNERANYQDQNINHGGTESTEKTGSFPPCPPCLSGESLCFHRPFSANSIALNRPRALFKHSSNAFAGTDSEPLPAPAS